MEKQVIEKYKKILLYILPSVLLILLLCYTIINLSKDNSDEILKIPVHAVATNLLITEMQVHIINEATAEQVEQVGEALMRIQEVDKIELITPEDAYNQMESRLIDLPDALEGIESSIFSASYRVFLNDFEKVNEVQEQIEKTGYIKKITTWGDEIPIGYFSITRRDLKELLKEDKMTLRGFEEMDEYQKTLYLVQKNVKIELED